MANAVRTLKAQRYPALEIVAVDNASTDGTAAALVRRLGEDRVIRAERNAGFGRAVAAALRHPAASGCEYVLLHHDDLALVPDAVAWMVQAMQADDSLAIVGPKLREWSEEHLLQQVGLSADVFGRIETGLDPGEVDQGQHDGDRDVLFVSTAGMLVRRDVVTAIGGFDARFDAFGDDFDLCWRVWLSGRRVGVVPDAIGYHIGAGAAGLRAPWQRPAEVRFRRERHTLAALLKNYSAARLAWVLPIGTLVGLVRVLGLLVSRRFGEAAAVVGALVWNLAQLPQTLRRRRVIQASRRLSDRDLRPLFAPGLPAVRTAAEALAELVAGGSSRALVDVDDPLLTRTVDPLADRPVLRFLRDRPLTLVGLPVLAAFVLGIGGLLGGGPLVGGEIAAFPDSPLDFFDAYLSPWGGEPLGSASFPSPIQPLLGIVAFIAGGSAWLAQRLAVFGLLPLAFVLTLRAGRLVTSRGWPRVLGATVYTLSPPLLTALAKGRWGTLLVGALLPAAVALTARAGARDTPPGTAWRSAALLAITTVIAVGAAPVEGLLVVAVVAVGALVALLGRAGRGLLRLVSAAALAAALLSPWLLDLLREQALTDGLLTSAGLTTAGTAEPIELWRALLLVPDLLDGIAGPLGVVVALVPGAIVVGALLVGLRGRPVFVTGLLLLHAVAGVGAWALAHFRVPGIWPPAVLLLGSVATAILAVAVARWSAEVLQASSFGIVQLGTALAGLALVTGLVADLGLLAGRPWTDLALDPQLVPAFVSAEEGRVGPYRVLLLDARGDDEIGWEVTRATGPSMLDFGTIRSSELTDLVADAVAQAAAGGDPAAGERLGLANIRYVVLSRPDAELQAALAAQPSLDPLPSAAGIVYRVASWLPRAGVVTDPAAARLVATGLPGRTAGSLTEPLRPVHPGDYRGRDIAVPPGLLVLSEATSTLWEATDGTVVLDRVDVEGINAFAVPEPEIEPRFRVRAAGAFRRRLVVAGQLLLVVVALSLAVRPPGVTQRRQRQRLTELPEDLADVAVTGRIPVIRQDEAPTSDDRADDPPALPRGDREPRGQP